MAGKIKRGEGKPMGLVYDAEDVWRFACAEEGYYFDRKSSRKDAAEIAKHIAAFANAGGGRIVIGIEDDGEITGFKRAKAHRAEDFEQAALTMCVPSPSVSVTRVPMINSKDEADIVLVLDILAAEGHVIKLRSDGRVALREGDRSVWLDHEQIRALEYDKGQLWFENELCRESSIEDIDPEAVALYKSAIGTTLSDERVLRSKHFLRGDKLTNAGVLLFAREPSFMIPSARLRVLRIEGTQLQSGANMNIVKDRTFDGPLVKVVPQAKEFIASQLREFQFQAPGGKFVTVPEYPEYAWFEGMVNAVTHRDYSLFGDYARVYLFDDRLEVFSPGKLPNIVTLDTMRSTRWSRNQQIARVFTAFDWVRELNEGVGKIYSVMQDAGLPEPEFSEPNGFSVKLVLRNDIENRVPRLKDDKPSFIPSHDEGINDEIKLKEDEIAILEMMKEDREITTRQIELITGFSESKVYRLVRSLRERGIVLREGSRKTGRWIVRL